MKQDNESGQHERTAEGTWDAAQEVPCSNCGGKTVSKQDAKHETNARTKTRNAESIQLENAIQPSTVATFHTFILSEPSAAVRHSSISPPFLFSSLMPASGSHGYDRKIPELNYLPRKMRPAGALVTILSNIRLDGRNGR